MQEYIPGEQIKFTMVLDHSARIVHVDYNFKNADTDDALVIPYDVPEEGQAGRTHADVEWEIPANQSPGDYKLESIEVTTFTGDKQTAENPSPDYSNFRINPEPETPPYAQGWDWKRK